MPWSLIFWALVVIGLVWAAAAIIDFVILDPYPDPEPPDVDVNAWKQTDAVSATAERPPAGYARDPKDPNNVPAKVLTEEWARLTGRQLRPNGTAVPLPNAKYLSDGMSGERIEREQTKDT